MTTKQTKSFRFSETTLARLENLSKKAELTQTVYLEQLLKKEADKQQVTGK